MLIFTFGFFPASVRTNHAFNRWVDNANTSITPLSAALSRRAGTLSIVLFSQEGCRFCATVRQNYLRPLAVKGPADIAVAEVEIGNPQVMTDWHGARTTQAELARAHGVRFAPTVMFFSTAGREMAPPIVGLSQDFFGAYLDARIAQARAAARAMAG